MSKLLPSQIKTKKLIFEKIAYLGSRRNLLLFGKNGIGKTYLGRNMEKYESFSYVDLTCIGYNNYIEQKNNDRVKAKDIISDIINPIISGINLETSNGLIIDNIDPIFLLYKRNNKIKSNITRFIRFGCPLPIVLISSMPSIFNLSLEENELDFYYKPILDEINYVIQNFTNDDVKFFTSQILDELPISKGNNIYEILYQKKLRRVNEETQRDN